MSELDAVNLSKAARAAAAAGDHEEAEALFRQALAIQPDDKNALMSLAALSDDVTEKRQLLRRVLALDPFHEEAQAALARLDGVNETNDGQEGVRYCANHPDRETVLRCNRCNKPICMECAVQTPVGYRCRECVYEQQNKFYTATTSNKAMGYVGAFVGGVILGIGAALLTTFLGGFWSFLVAIFAGPAIGGALSELIFRASGRKRARQFNIYATIIVVGVGTLIAFGPALLSRGFLGIIAAMIMIAAAGSAVYARLR